MLQQTQVSAVVPYFVRFMNALPTLEALAAADEQSVLRLWQGLGYYSRARNLWRAAQIIVEQHGGEVPRNLELLRSLPGIGRYTAGAIASIAWGERAPVVDGNVARVLCRLALIRHDSRMPVVQKKLWKMAESLLPRDRCGDFNSALMELGAIICTPRAPKCQACPLRRHCRAFATGLPEEIPRPAKRKSRPLLHRDVFVIRDAHGRFLIEQRPPRGRWASMWQFITRPRGSLPPASGKPRPLGRFQQILTHRRYDFRVLLCQHANVPLPQAARWATPKELDTLAMPRSQLQVLRMMQERG